MLEFIIQILTRWLSGVKQAYFYQKKWYEGIYFSLLMLAGYVTWAAINKNPWGYIVPALAAINYAFLANAFYKDKSKQVHTLEYLGNYIFNFGAFFFGGDLLGLIFAIYVGDFLFNLPIQKYFTGNYLNEVAITDDPTGKTTNFYLFGREFKVPNLFTSGYTKMYAAIIFTIAYIFVLHKGWHLTIKDILKLKL